MEKGNYQETSFLSGRKFRLSSKNRDDTHQMRLNVAGTYVTFFFIEINQE